MKIICLLLLCALNQLLAECPTSCRCSRYLHDIQCRNRSLSEVPVVGPGLSIYNLDLSHNHLTVLRNDSFQSRNIVELYRLYVGFNEISIVEVDAFRGVGENLISLNMQHNPHIRLPDVGFHLPALAFLYLSSCNLTNIPPSFFKGMPDLMTLSLRDNSLTHFDPVIVHPRTGLQLELLLLSQNKFTRLSLELVAVPGMTVGFGGNPFHCGCEFRIAYTVLARRGDVDVICASPPRLQGVTGAELLDMSLRCDVSTSELEENSTWWSLHQWWFLSVVMLIGVFVLAFHLLRRHGNCQITFSEFPFNFIDIRNRNGIQNTSSTDGRNMLIHN